MLDSPGAVELLYDREKHARPSLPTVEVSPRLRRYQPTDG